MTICTLKWQVFLSPCNITNLKENLLLSLTCFSFCFWENCRLQSWNSVKLMFSACGWKGQSTVTTQKPFKYHLALQYAFLLPGQPGHVWCSQNLLQMKQWSYMPLVWLLESRSYLISSYLLSCFSLCCNTISFILVVQSEHSHGLLPWNYQPRTKWVTVSLHSHKSPLRVAGMMRSP